jgi:hypothetical protein
MIYTDKILLTEILNNPISIVTIESRGGIDMQVDNKNREGKQVKKAKTNFIFENESFHMQAFSDS